MKLDGWKARCVVALVYRSIQLCTWTLRFKLEDRAGFTTMPLGDCVISALWHNRVLLLPYIARAYVPQRRPVALISASAEGGLLAGLVRRYGVEAARGSSSRKGAIAMLRLAESLRAGHDIAITPDGPRGPVYELGAGIVFLAQKSGVPVLLTNIEYSSCWRLQSWDRFILPKPFSTVRVIFDSLHHVAITHTDGEFESERLRLQSAMMQLVEMR